MAASHASGSHHASARDWLLPLLSPWPRYNAAPPLLTEGRRRTALLCGSRPLSLRDHRDTAAKISRRGRPRRPCSLLVLETGWEDIARDGSWERRGNMAAAGRSLQRSCGAETTHPGCGPAGWIGVLQPAHGTRPIHEQVTEPDEFHGDETPFSSHETLSFNNSDMSVILLMWYPI
uniref:Uncharacterized protein n=1 Tax=Oryza brachyantha TaxID=4533 RepID=J3L2I8_ORYBR